MTRLSLLPAGAQKSLFAARLLLSVLCCVLLLGAAAQDYSKIDVAFHSLIADPFSKKPLVHFKQLRSVEPLRITPDGRSAPVYNCIVYTDSGSALREDGIAVNSIVKGFVTAQLTTDQIVRLSLQTDVRFIKAPAVRKLHNEVARGGSGAYLLHNGAVNNTSYTGTGVIVAIFDTGIDWDHPDFRMLTDQKKSRILRMWDQTLTAGNGEAPPNGFNYGVEYTQSQISNELDGTPTGFVRERDIHGHGTHVAGTAAGNGAALATHKYRGMAPDADLVIIKGGDAFFVQSNTVDALTYLKALSASLNRPIVLNMSIGNFDGPHDGTEPEEVAIDDFTNSGPGRIAVLSGGNDRALNNHRRVVLPANGSFTTTVRMAANTTLGEDIFYHKTWLPDNRPVTAIVTGPNGETLTATSGEINQANTADNAFTILLVNTINPGNDHRYIEVDLIRNGVNGVTAAGTWKIKLTNPTATARVTHSWLVFSAYENTKIDQGDNNFMTSSPGNALTAITVASYAGQTTWYNNVLNDGVRNTLQTNDLISNFSSRGPRADNISKPDITANGQYAISCLSSEDPIYGSSTDEMVVGGLYRAMEGTSMAAPVVAGCAALLMQARPGSTAAFIKQAIIKNASKDDVTEGAGFSPNFDWGAGKIDVFRTAASFFGCPRQDRQSFQYDNHSPNAANKRLALAAQHIAQRITPTTTGKLGSVSFYTAAKNTTTPFSLTSLKLQIRAKATNTQPGALLGELTIPPVSIDPYSWNDIDVSSLNIDVTAKQDYFVVIVPGASSQWGLMGEATDVSGRSLLSTNSGGSYSPSAYDLRIRSSAYTTTEGTAHIAVNTASKSQTISNSQFFLSSDCELIAVVKAAGANPVNGSVKASVKVNAAPQSNGGISYVGRYFDIQPAIDPATATSELTLFFIREEFDDFNETGGVTQLPTSASDATGIANLRISQYRGTSTTGNAGTYSGAGVIINPDDDDVVYNLERGRWEITFPVMGNGGFFVQTSLTVLPVSVDYFRAGQSAEGNRLSWKVNCYGTSHVGFEIERSSDGENFSSIGSLSGTVEDCQHEFSFNDRMPLTGQNYYRVKITEDNGQLYYTSVLLISIEAVTTNSLYPSPVKRGGSVLVRFSSNRGLITFYDLAGRKMMSRSLVSGTQQISIHEFLPGVYIYELVDENDKSVRGKLMVE